MISCDPDDTLADVTNKFIDKSRRVRKGAVLKEWIEDAASDLVVYSVSPNRANWIETQNVLSQYSAENSMLGVSKNKPRKTSGPEVKALHPDAQLAHGKFLNIKNLNPGVSF